MSEQSTNGTVWNALAQWLAETPECNATFYERDGRFVCSLAFDFCSMEGFGESLDQAAFAALSILEQERGRKRVQ